MKLKFSWQTFKKSSNIKCYQNPSSESRVVACGQADRWTDGWTDMTTLIATFCNFANMPKNDKKYINIFYNNIWYVCVVLHFLVLLQKEFSNVRSEIQRLLSNAVWYHVLWQQFINNFEKWTAYTFTTDDFSQVHVHTYKWSKWLNVLSPLQQSHYPNKSIRIP